MERLTIRVPDEPAYAYDEDAWTVNDEFGVCCLVGPVVDRLAAYEDTGLEPSEVAELQSAAADLSVELSRKNVECAKLEDEVAALRARCAAAEKENVALQEQIDALRRFRAAVEGRGPQEGATAHERV